MLKKIKSIKANEGVFKDFEWDKDCPDFAKCNVIYGLNGTGKTILSQCLSVNSEFGEAKINNLSLRVQNEFSEKEKGALKIKVFNKEYIKENFFVGGSEKIEKVILGKHDIAKIKEIDTVTETIRKLENEKIKIKSKLSDIASSLKNQMAIVNFTITKLIPELTKLNSLEEEIIEENDLKNIWDNYKAMPLQTKQKINCIANLPVKNIEKLVSKNILRAEVIERLAENSNIAKWVQDGIEINEGKKECQFCEKSFDDGWIEKLKNHFNEEVKSLQNEINSYLQTINTLKQDINIKKEKINSFPKVWENDIQEAKQSFTEKETIYLDYLEKIITKIKNKILNPYSSSSIENLVGEFQKAENDFNRVISNIDSSIIDKFNQEQQNINTIKEQAKKKIIKNTIARNLKNFYESPSDDGNSIGEKINTLCNNNFVITNPINSIDSAITREGIAKSNLEQEISKADNFSNQINDGLKYFFGNEDLQIKTMNNKTPGYYIFRNGKETKAETLSEGERTAIIFLYFLCSTKGRKNYKENEVSIEKITVIIDDPISSFDIMNLHFAFICMEIRISSSYQFFILTHNTDFLSLVLRWLKKKKREKEGKVGFFMLEKIQENNNTPYTRIIEMPKEVKDDIWKFYVLFEELFEFQKNIISQPNSLEKKGALDSSYIPNKIRKFLEIYTSICAPRVLETQNALEKIWGKEKKFFIRSLLATTNNFSHENINRSTNLEQDVMRRKTLIRQMFDEIERHNYNFFDSLGKDRNINYHTYEPKNSSNKTERDENKNISTSHEQKINKENKNGKHTYSVRQQDLF